MSTSAAPPRHRQHPKDARLRALNRLVDGPVRVVRENWRAYLWINGLLFGVFVVSLLTALAVPGLHESVVAHADDQLSGGGWMGTVGDAYGQRRLVLAAVVTLTTNIALGAVGTISLPSLVLPFFGVAFSVYRVVNWGFLFVPAGPDAAALLPHYLTLIGEGQAYVLATLAVWIHGRRWLWPRRFGFSTYRRGYVQGLKLTLRIYPLVLVLLVVSAFYEAFEVIYLVPALS